MSSTTISTTSTAATPPGAFASLSLSPLRDDEDLCFAHEDEDSLSQDESDSGSGHERATRPRAHSRGERKSKDYSHGSHSHGRSHSRDKSSDDSDAGIAAFKGQAAGHSKILTIGHDKIAKPCNPHEKEIYEVLKNDEGMAPWVAKYFGTMHHDTSEEVRRFQTKGEYIVLENLTSPFTRPSVLDLKLGYKQWVEGNMDKDKVTHRKLKAALSGAVEYGFRVSGVRVFYPGDDSYFVRGQESKIGNRIGRARFIQTIELFLFNGVRIRTDVIAPLIRKLHGICAALEAHTLIDFEASSILLVYEGQPDVTLGLNEESPVDVRLIDFDHARIRPPEERSALASGAVRSGVLVAVRSLLRFLERISRLTSHSNSMVDVLSAKGVSPLTFPVTRHHPRKSEGGDGGSSDGLSHSSPRGEGRGVTHSAAEESEHHRKFGHDHSHSQSHDHEDEAQRNHRVRSNSIGSAPPELKLLTEHKNKEHGGHNYSPLVPSKQSHHRVEHHHSAGQETTKH